VIFVYFGLFISFVKEISLFFLIQNKFLIIQSFHFSLNESLLKTEYLGVLIYFIIALVLSLVFVTLSYFLSIQNPDLEKLSTYECGFEPYEDARHRFDIKFCVIAILFIVFDIEIMFLFPWCLTLSQLNLLGFWSMVDFMLELGVAFIYV
jgi:NADH:ubiquinone oxidoreductase subunit 3 (subunit A)